METAHPQGHQICQRGLPEPTVPSRCMGPGLPRGLSDLRGSGGGGETRVQREVGPGLLQIEGHPELPVNLTIDGESVED